MKRATYFNPHKTALTCALVFAIGSLLFILPMVALTSFIPMKGQDGEAVNATFPGIVFLLMPIVYFIFGYLSTAFSAWLYNRISKFTGGIVCEITEQ